MKTINQVILELLSTSPPGQLAEEWRTKVATFEGNELELRDLLVKIHNSPKTDASNFVRTMCLPEYICSDNYMYAKSNVGNTCPLRDEQSSSKNKAS